MRRWPLVVMLFVLCVGSLTGCWSRRELTDVSLVGVIAVDWVDEQYMITANIAMPRAEGGETAAGGKKSAVWTLSTKARSLDEAIGQLDQIAPREITLAHVRAIILGEAMARRGIAPLIDFLLRSVEIRPTAWMAVTPGLARDLMDVRPEQTLVPAEGPLGFQEVAQRRSGLVQAQRLTTVASILKEEGIDNLLPVFRTADERFPRPTEGMHRTGNPREVIYGGGAVFKGDRMVAWLTPEEARGALWAKGVPFAGVISAACPDSTERVVFRIRRVGGRATLSQSQGKLEGQIQVRVVADLNEDTCSDPKGRQADTALLEKLLTDQIASEVNRALRIARETGSDFLGLGRSLFRKNARAYTSRQDDWAEVLAAVPVTTTIRPQVPRLGQLERRFK